jgi:hypothetical protein
MDRFQGGISHPDHPMRNPAAAARLLGELRVADPLAALADLTAWLRELEHIPDGGAAVEAEILALVQEAGDPHAGALMAASIAKAGKQQAQKPAWPAIDGYLTASLHVTHRSAARLLEHAQSDAARPLAAAAAARALHACRMLAKACLLRHADFPSDGWRAAYTLHRQAEACGCAALPVRMHAGHRTTTTANHELVRLLMLQCASAEMMPATQIEVADWVTEQLGGEFTLRPRGAMDNPFCFDAAGEAPPHRAAQEPDAALRYFGPGIGYEALQRMYSQMSTSGAADPAESAEASSRDVRLAALQHLLLFWGEKAPYTPPDRTPATGQVRVVRGYSQAWQQISRGGKATTELTLAEDGDVPLAAPETWTLVHKGGSELGVHLPQSSGECVGCGDVVALSTDFGEGWWLGLIRSMHVVPGQGMDATIHVISQHPQALQVRSVIEDAGERGVTEQTARQFSYANVKVIVVSDGLTTKQPANLLVPSVAWKAGRSYEVTADGGGDPRYVRCGRLLRRGDDYVRVGFDWTDKA